MTRISTPFRRRTLAAVLAAGCLLFTGAGPAFAIWSAGNDSGGAYVRNAEAKIYVRSDRVAERTARKLNRIEKRAEEKGDGFMPSEDGPCADPASGVKC